MCVVCDGRFAIMAFVLKALLTLLSVMCTQDRLKNALHACRKNYCFALEQLERAAHEATGVCIAESRELYKLGKEHLVVLGGSCRVSATYAQL